MADLINDQYVPKMVHIASAPVYLNHSQSCCWADGYNACREEILDWMKEQEETESNEEELEWSHENILSVAQQIAESLELIDLIEDKVEDLYQAMSEDKEVFEMYASDCEI